MKAFLVFDFPEDRGDHDMALHGLDWALVAWDMDQWLRRQIKYGPAAELDDLTLEKVRDVLRTAISDHGVSLDDIQ